jgi:MFS family permease
VVTAYLLTSTAVTPLYGKLSDMHGRRAMMLIGIGVFMAGSLACAVAPNMLMLILARAVQGMGAGGLLPLAQTIIGDVVLPKERGRYQAYLGSMWMMASITGPLLGGVLSEYLHWSLIFWINIPLGFLAFLASREALKRLPRHERPHKLDILGSLLMVAAAIALLLALTSGGTRFPWSSAPILGLFTLSAALWVVFATRLLWAPEPFLPLNILANQVVRMGTLAAACNVGTMIGLTIFVPLYFESVLGLSSSLSGLFLIPLMLVSNLGSIIAGRGLAMFRHYKRVPMLGLCHRHHEFLPRAAQRHHRRVVGRDRARRHQSPIRRRPECRNLAGQRGRRRSRAAIPLGIRGGGGVSRHLPVLPHPNGGEAASRPRRYRGGNLLRRASLGGITRGRRCQISRCISQASATFVRA